MYKWVHLPMELVGGTITTFLSWWLVKNFAYNVKCMQTIFDLRKTITLNSTRLQYYTRFRIRLCVILGWVLVFLMITISEVEHRKNHTISSDFSWFNKFFGCYSVLFITIPTWHIFYFAFLERNALTKLFKAQQLVENQVRTWVATLNYHWLRVILGRRPTVFIPNPNG